MSALRKSLLTTSEDELGRSAAEFLDWALPPSCRYTHIASGGKRHPAVAGQMKAQGVRRGAPDYVIVGPHGGLWIELKSATGVLSDEQEAWRDVIVVAPGQRWALCRSIDEVIGACLEAGIAIKARQTG